MGGKITTLKDPRNKLRVANVFRTKFSATLSDGPGLYDVCAHTQDEKRPVTSTYVYNGENKTHTFFLNETVVAAFTVTSPTGEVYAIRWCDLPENVEAGYMETYSASLSHYVIKGETLNWRAVPNTLLATYVIEEATVRIMEAETRLAQSKTVVNDRIQENDVPDNTQETLRGYINRYIQGIRDEFFADFGVTAETATEGQLELCNQHVEHKSYNELLYAEVRKLALRTVEILQPATQRTTSRQAMILCAEALHRARMVVDYCDDILADFALVQAAQEALSKAKFERHRIILNANKEESARILAWLEETAGYS